MQTCHQTEEDFHVFLLSFHTFGDFCLISSGDCVAFLREIYDSRWRISLEDTLTLWPGPIRPTELETLITFLAAEEGKEKRIFYAFFGNQLTFQINLHIVQRRSQKITHKMEFLHLIHFPHFLMCEPFALKRKHEYFSHKKGSVNDQSGFFPPKKKNEEEGDSPSPLPPTHS